MILVIVQLSYNVSLLQLYVDNIHTELLALCYSVTAHNNYYEWKKNLLKNSKYNMIEVTYYSNQAGFERSASCIEL